MALRLINKLLVFIIACGIAGSGLYLAYKYFYRPIIVWHVDRGNQRKLAEAVLAYARKNNGNLPASFEELVSIGLLPERGHWYMTPDDPRYGQAIPIDESSYQFTSPDIKENKEVSGHYIFRVDMHSGSKIGFAENDQFFEEELNKIRLSNKRQIPTLAPEVPDKE